MILQQLGCQTKVAEDPRMVTLNGKHMLKLFVQQSYISSAEQAVMVLFVTREYIYIYIYI